MPDGKVTDAKQGEPLVDRCTVLATMPVGVFTIDLQGVIRFWNRAMEGLTGYALDEAVGMPCVRLQCDACRETPCGRPEERCPALQGESVAGLECTIRDRNGGPVPVMKAAEPIRDAGGNVVGAVHALTGLRPAGRLDAAQVPRLSGGKGQRTGFGRLVGKSRVMQDVYERIRLAADSEATVLVLGETGTGKELVAEAIHEFSGRRGGPHVKVNCSALSENLLESELFGHVKGSFTGAVRDKPGRFELADGGTIFLDEIGDVSPLIQLKLLRVLQEHEFERVGDVQTRKVDVRVIAATHRDLRELVATGRLRQDLYYRLRVFAVHAPPLRSRKEDIPLLVDAFIARFNRETGKQIDGISHEVAHCLMDYCWPGNVRELENTIEHAFVTCPGGQIGLFDLPLEVRMTELRRAECINVPAPGGVFGTKQPVGGPRTTGVRGPQQLVSVLNECGWNKAEAARRLGVTRTTVWRKMKEWQIPLSPGDDRG